MTGYLKILVLIDFHSDAIFPFNRAAPYGDERGSRGARLNEREERGASPRLDPRPHSSLPRERQGFCALRDGAKDLTRRNFLSTPFQTLSDQKFRGATGRTNLKIFPRCPQLPEIQNTINIIKYSGI